MSCLRISSDCGSARTAASRASCVPLPSPKKGDVVRILQAAALPPEGNDTRE